MDAFNSLLAHNGCIGLFKGQTDFDCKGSGQFGNRGTTGRGRTVLFVTEHAPAVKREPRVPDLHLENSVDSFATLAEDEELVGRQKPQTWEKVRTVDGTVSVSELLSRFRGVDTSFVLQLWEHHRGHVSVVHVLAATVDPATGTVARAFSTFSDPWPALPLPRANADRKRLLSGVSDAGSDWDVVSRHSEPEEWELVPQRDTLEQQPRKSYAAVLLSFMPAPSVEGERAKGAPLLPAKRTGRRLGSTASRGGGTPLDGFVDGSWDDAAALQLDNKMDVARLRGYSVSRRRPQEVAQRAKRIAMKAQAQGRASQKTGR